MDEHETRSNREFCLFVISSYSKLYTLKVYWALFNGIGHFITHISTITFLASLDNDRSTVETSYFTVDFYCPFQLFSCPFPLLFLASFTLATFCISYPFWLLHKVGCWLRTKSGNGTLISYRSNGPFYDHFCTKTDNVDFQVATSQCH